MNKEIYDRLLFKYFGINHLKDLQYDIIENCMNGNDVLALLPTSYGKSICYQLQYIISKKCVVVIEPLISLINDQIIKLNKLDIPVICLNSTNKEKTRDLESIYSGICKIIYATPEYIIANPHMLVQLKELDKISLIAIDESHCLSNWGHDFRPDYKKLGIIREILPDIPILALTATATQRVQTDIITTLNFKNTKIIQHSFDRKNLYIAVKKRDSASVISTIVKLIKQITVGKTLIYCSRIKDVEKVCDMINEYSIKCLSYFAANPQKDENQEAYTNGDVDVMVATNAFGMGIDIPNIRLLIHYNSVKDIESYLQEIGRAGRDNCNSCCYMFYGGSDFMVNSSFLKDIIDQEQKRSKEKELMYVTKYINTDECRRKLLFSHFGENIDKCGNCDNCKSHIKNPKKNYESDVTKETILLLNLLKLGVAFGEVTYIKLLLGSKDAKTKKILNRYDILSKYHGLGKHKSEEWWKLLIVELIACNYVRIERLPGIYTTYILKIIINGVIWLENIKKTHEPLILTIPLKQQNTFYGDVYDDDIYNSIKSEIALHKQKFNATFKLDIFFATTLSKLSSKDICLYDTFENLQQHVIDHYSIVK